jgi:hypothetical protein
MSTCDSYDEVCLARNSLKLPSYVVYIYKGCVGVGVVVGVGGCVSVWVYGVGGCGWVWVTVTVQRCNPPKNN